MGRHAQTSSLNTTLIGLGTLAGRCAASASAATSHRAAGSAHTSIAPVMWKAGAGAAALALTVSTGAYAAVNAVADDPATSPKSATSLQAIGSTASTASDTSTASTTGLTISGAETSVTTLTQDEQEAYGTVEEESATLAQGEKSVKTPGVNGVTRTTYQVTTQDGKEVSRQVLSSVVVTEKVDEVVLVGTGTAATTTATANLAASGTDAAAAQAIAASMMSSYGWGDEQFTCLVNLWDRESGWNYQASNSSSGAYGIAQALPGSKMASAGADWETNPATQITWGLGYISGRYGDPCSAWSHSESTGWY